MLYYNSIVLGQQLCLEYTVHTVAPKENLLVHSQVPVLRTEVHYRTKTFCQPIGRTCFCLFCHRPPQAGRRPGPMVALWSNTSNPLGMGWKSPEGMRTACVKPLKRKGSWMPFPLHMSCADPPDWCCAGGCRVPGVRISFKPCGNPINARNVQTFKLSSKAAQDIAWFSDIPWSKSCKLHINSIQLWGSGVNT